MISMTFKAADAKNLFFDRAKVVNALHKKTLRGLSKAGAFVRTRSRHSIRKRKGISAAGGPPHSHVGLLRDKIFFFLDPSREVVVVGPVRLNKPGEAPRLLEKGGMFRRNGRTMRYAARPFMKPALDAEAPKFPSFWAETS